MTEQNYQHFVLTQDDQKIYWAAFEKHGASTNSINPDVLTELNQVLDTVSADKTAAALVILSAKNKGFIAGADVEHFKKFKEADDVAAFIRSGHETFNRLSSFNVPTVAMIDGFCMGGGLELALACHYRVVTDSDETKLGLPEVNLGIHPGWGGCVRLPKLIGSLKAMDMILTGRPIRAKVAKRMGFVDVVVPKRQLKKAVLAIINSKPKVQPLMPIDAFVHGRGLMGKLQQSTTATGRWLSNCKPARILLAKILRRKVGSKALQKHYPAPYAVIDNFEDYGVSDHAMGIEQQSIIKMAMTQTSRNLVRVFFLQELLKNQGKACAFKAKHVHVIGAGTMGGDIAAWCALRGLRVTLQDQAHANIAPSIARAHKLFSRKLKDPRKVMATMDRLIPDVQGNGIAKADVIIEAIFENLDAKQALFARIEKEARADAVLASNTSSIPIEDISATLNQPERLVGIHFFNPVAKMPLVEIVQGDKTQEQVMQNAISFVRQIGKLPLPVKSSPGFLVNRILMPYLMEAVTLLEEGHHAIAIDDAAKEFGMPMGPIELADTVGLDVCLSVAENLIAHYGGSVPDILTRKIAAKELGRKTGQGFYQYKKGKLVKPKAPVMLEETKLQEVQDRLVLRMINEAVSCLRERVVADAELLDAGMIFGTGFAPFTGGPLHYAKQRGIVNLTEILEKLQQQHGERFHADNAWQTLTEELPQ